MKRAEILDEIWEVIEDRAAHPSEESYTSKILTHRKGIDKSLEKIGEESTEVVIAAKNESKEEAVYEISDLIYHLTVLMNYMGVTFEEIGAELLKRSR